MNKPYFTAMFSNEINTVWLLSLSARMTIFKSKQKNQNYAIHILNNVYDYCSTLELIIGLERIL